MVAGRDQAGRQAGRHVGAPQGNIGRGEDPEATAVREVAEETGIEAVSTGKLGDVRYVYTGRQADLQGRELLPPPLPPRPDRRPAAVPPRSTARNGCRLRSAPRLLAYKSEREMAEKALAALQEEEAV